MFGKSLIVRTALGLALMALMSCGDPARTGSDGREGDGSDVSFNNFLDEDAGESDADAAGDGPDAAPEDVDQGGEDVSGEDAAVDVEEPDVAVDVEEPDVSEEPDVAEEPDVMEEPDDHWPGTDGLEDDALEQALRSEMESARVFSYNQARDLMYGRAANIDVRDGEIECVYTGRRVRPDGSRTPGGFNTEHSWPQVDGADSEPMVSDLHHIYPTDEDANSARANFDYGDTDCTRCDYDAGGSMLGPDRDGPGTVFEVRPARRGDIARAHFYFAVRYNRAIPAGEEATLRDWHEQDPPDELERGRNDRIESFQRNRNPFVDRPEFVDRIANF